VKATTDLHLEIFRRNEVKLIEAGELAPQKKHGSNQSELPSFEFLIFNNSTSLTLKAQEMAYVEFLERPQIFYQMGVPEGVVIPKPTRQRNNGRGFGDDRHRASGYRGERSEDLNSMYDEPDQNLNVLLAMVHTSDAYISTKTGKQDTSVPFTLSTFCAHAIESGVNNGAGRVHVVSDARKFLRTFGIDGPGPSMGPAPNWYLTARSWRNQDPGAASVKKRLLKGRTQGQLMAASSHCCQQLPYSTLRNATRVEKEGLVGFEEAIALSLPLFPMPSHNPNYLSYAKAAKLVEKSSREYTGSVNTRDESFIDVYDDLGLEDLDGNE